MFLILFRYSAVSISTQRLRGSENGNGLRRRPCHRGHRERQRRKKCYGNDYGYGNGENTEDDNGDGDGFTTESTENGEKMLRPTAAATVTARTQRTATASLAALRSPHLADRYEARAATCPLRQAPFDRLRIYDRASKRRRATALQITVWARDHYH